MEAEDPPLGELAGAVLDGQQIDWGSAESSANAPNRGAVRQLKVLAGIASLHQKLTGDSGEPASPRVPEGKPERWGRLEVLERIGQGAFGEVYRAWDSKLDREVAVKLLHGGGERPEGATVLREARLLARVRHPNVVIVYDADEIEGRVGLWMEFIYGRNLEQILGDRERFDDREVTRIGIELCRALSAVHDAGLLHRDIKAQNLMQAEDGRLVLMDFGTGHELEQTPAPAVDAAGTPLYLAPEIFRGSRASVRSDIYSAGVLLFHLLTGAYPVHGRTVEEVAAAHARGDRRDFATMASGVSATLAAVINRAIRPAPSERFESSRDMLAALESVLREIEGRNAKRSSSRERRRAALIGIGVGVMTLAAGAVAWLSHGASPPSPGKLQAIPFRARDSVLVSRFENRTGVKLFDGTLDYALARELSNSRHVAVVSPDRVNDALRLMRRPPDTPLDAALAREVCLRDGGIRALLTGRVEKPGSKYLLNVELVDAKGGATLASFHEESAGSEGSLAAVRRISDRVRAVLGEASPLIDSERAGLAKVTTDNLRALQLYSQANLLMRQEGHQAAAEELLRQAVAEDPTFASAWIHLAWTLRNQEKPLAEYQPFAETALRLADKTTERERYFIRGSFYDLLGEREKAIAAYEALLALYPDHEWAPNNVCHLYDWYNNPIDLEKSVEVEARSADSRPNDFMANWNAAFDFVAIKPHRARAEPYLRRASERITPEVRENLPGLVNWIELLPFTEKWINGELEAAAGEIDRVAAKIDPLVGLAHDTLAAQTALGYLTLGRIAAAERTSEKIVDPVVRNDMLAQIAFVKEDAAALRERLQLLGKRQAPQPQGDWEADRWDTVVLLKSRAGLLRDLSTLRSFEKHLDSNRYGGKAVLHTIRGEIALAHGNREAAIRELEEARRLSGGPYFPDHGFGRESLASALAKNGDVSGAIRVLEWKSERYYAVIRGETGAHWLRNRLQLARLYRKAGREEAARAVEAELSKMLALADTDHPILRELRGAGRP